MEAVATDDILNEKHLIRLTGRRWKSKQIEWLRSECIPFRISATGHPVVLWSAVKGGREVVENDGWTPAVLGG